MIFRWLFVISYLVFVINVSVLFKTESANVLEKGLFLSTSFAFLMTRRIDKFNMWLLIFVFVVLIFQTFLIEYSDFSGSTFVSALNQPFIIFSFLCGIPTSKDKEFLNRFVSFLPILSTCIGIVYQVTGIKPVFDIEFSTGLARFSGSLIPAFLSGLGMIGTFAALQCFFRRQSFALPILVLDAFVLMISGGRAALASTVIVCGVAIIVAKEISRKAKIRIAFSICAIFLLAVAALWDRIITRFTESGDNGRDLMADYLNTVAKQYPEGIGFGHQYFSVPDHIKNLVGSYAAHNDYLRLTVELGVWLAALFYVLYAVGVVRILFRNKNRGDWQIVAAFLAYLFISRTDNALATPPYFPLVFMGYLASISIHDKRLGRRTTTIDPEKPTLSRSFYERQRRTRNFQIRS